METVLDEQKSTINITNTILENKPLSMKDFKTDQDVRWCPGCGDYAILAQMQKVLPELGIPRENIVFVSGIGCSSRFPYYMNTYGFHTIHGRATAIATGLKIARPELSVWVVTGDGDGMSIGGNHFIHALRRNVDFKVLLFNNEIYGLTKGQYSPTSPVGLVTKSTPVGSLDAPFNPLALALGAGGSFVARTLDRDLKHMNAVLKRAAEHVGTALVEIYQNCVVFNDGAFFEFTEKETKSDSVVVVEHGKPLIFGKNSDKGVRLRGFTPEVISLESGEFSIDDVLVHDEHDKVLAGIIANMSDIEGLPRPIGVIYSAHRTPYEQLVHEQISTQVEKKGTGSLQDLLYSGETWTID